MPLTWVKCLVVALMTSVLLLAGLLAWVQPSSRLSFGPTVAPFGPQSLSFKSPWFFAASNSPTDVLPVVTRFGSITSSPPSQVTTVGGVAFGSARETQPDGLPPTTGTDT